MKVDLHVHTCTTSECGKVEPKEVVRLYKEAGYDGIAITDHFHKGYFESLGDIPWKEKMKIYLQGYYQTKEAAKEYNDFQVFLGIEFRNFETDDDFLVFGLTEEFLYENEKPYDLPLAEAIELFHSAGAIVVQAHPVRMRLAVLEDGQVRKNFKTEEMVAYLKEHPDTRRIPFIEGSRRIKTGEWEVFETPVFMRVCDLRCPELLDGIEVYNGNYNWMQDELEINKIMQTYPHLIGLSNADFHEPGHCGRAGMILEDDVKTDKELVLALKSKKMNIL